MNGRIFGSHLARFMQADPFIQAATHSQSYNRYSYTFNNPLNAADPSGYIADWVAAMMWVVGSYAAGDYARCNDIPWLGQVASIAGCMYGYCAAAAFGSTYGATQNLGVAMIAGISAGALSGMDPTARFLMSGMLGGTSSVMMGGKFGHGFISAGLGGLAGGDGPSAAFSYAMQWAAQRYEPGGSQPQQEVGASASGDPGNTSIESSKELASLNKAKNALQASTLSEKTLSNLNHSFDVSPGDAAFDEVVSALITNIDNTITALDSANYLPANAEGLGKVVIGGRGFTSEQIQLHLARIDPTAAAFVFAGDANKNIFLRDLFYYKNDFRRANALIHEASHFHPNGSAGGLAHPGNRSSLSSPGATNNPYNFSNFISTYSY